MSEQGLQDGHGNTSIPVQRSERVSERMPAEIWNSEAHARRPQVSPHEVAVTERRPLWYLGTTSQNV